MRRNGMGNIKKERIIMIASSAFVLAALTMTGIYMNRNNKASLDDGYTLDFGAFENNVEEKLGEIAKNNEDADSDANNGAEDGNGVTGMETDRILGSVTQAGENANNQTSLYDDLDYIPTEFEEENITLADAAAVENGTPEPEIPEMEEDKPQAVSGSQVQVAEELHFTEEGFHMPINGEILMSYSMDKRVYFSTLKQYRYNPATLFAASVGAEVFACGKAKITNIYEDAKLGTVVTMDLGDGYLATYGQLKDVKVSVGDYVEAGQVIASVDNPTKQYTLEGCNLYFEMTGNGEAINSEEWF
ncbi:MAG: M23 family metallopeptidase [Bacteroidales bacterium]|nr:M23 family metallopeptidase [Lachnoclostridium sp.]MCM1383966.1 M23 family metallopeptidase [Lachnoclostridium sp.]MCM1464675.1 M23 family metallopeptidase [Bacteroidales bacterium]